MCVVTKRLAKKAERVYNPHESHGGALVFAVHSRLDLLIRRKGSRTTSLTPELYAQFLCAMLDAWYRDWKPAPISASVCLRIIFICLWAALRGPAPRPVLLRCLYGCGRVAVPCTRATSSRLDAYKLELCKRHPCNRCLPARKMQTFITDGWQIPRRVPGSADGSACAAAAASATAMLPTLRSAVTNCKSPAKVFCLWNRACARWSAPFKCTAERRRRFYWTRK